MKSFLLRRYAVSVRGFSPVVFDAKSHGQARAAAYRSFCSYSDATSFKEFLQLVSSVTRVREVPEKYGQRIRVMGQPAHYVSHDGQYVQFVRPNDTTILNSHPLDVEYPNDQSNTERA